MSTGSSQARRLWATLALTVACSLWGATFLFAKMALTELPVSQVLLYRFLLAAFVFLILLARCKRVVRVRDIPLFLLSGFLTVPVTFLLQFTGLSLTNVTSAALIIGTVPPLIALAAICFLRERFTLWNWSAAALSLLGLILLVWWPGAGTQWVGDGFVFLSVLAVVGWTLINTYLARSYAAFDITAYTLLSGTLFLIPISLWWDGPPHVHVSVSVWLALLALGLLCTVITFALWNWAIQVVGASRAGVYLNLEPLVGALLGVVVMRDPFGIHQLFGGLLVITAAIMVSWPRKMHSEPNKNEQLVVVPLDRVNGKEDRE